jgi:penicillin-binding protein 1A
MPIGTPQPFPAFPDQQQQPMVRPDGTGDPAQQQFDPLAPQPQPQARTPGYAPQPQPQRQPAYPPPPQRQPVPPRSVPPADTTQPRPQAP